jgi:hypothetical protein
MAAERREGGASVVDGDGEEWCDGAGDRVRAASTTTTTTNKKGGGGGFSMCLPPPPGNATR